VTNGKNGMPAWEDTLSEEQIQAVAAYVFDQASNSKW
jgi:cytochrome c6